MINYKITCSTLSGLFIVSLITVSLIGCGGSIGGSGALQTKAPILMGGAVQGNSLSLTNIVTTIAGPVSADGVGAAASFNGPNGIATDGINLYVTDFNNNTIREIVISTGTVTTIAGRIGTAGSLDGMGVSASFNGPDGITSDGTNLYVTDERNNAIRKIGISSGMVTTIAGAAGSSGSADGIGSAAGFNNPRGITTDGKNLYVVDSGNGTIRKILISTGAVTTIAGTPGTSGSADGVGAAARFNSPWGITTDGTNLFVADEHNNTIRKIEISTGTVTTIAGTVNISGFADGIGSAALFNLPVGVTTDGTNLYVTDEKNCTIRKIEISTGTVTTIAGAAGSSGDTDGVGTAARFQSPWGIGLVGANLYVADSGNDTIREIEIPNGTVTTLAGSAGAADGTGMAARFRNPSGMTTDGTYIYVTDSYNHLIRRITIATGDVTTVAGSAGTPGSVDGTGTVARFNYSRGITTDGTSLFVADSYNNVIRKIVIATGDVTTIAGTAGVSGWSDGIGSAAAFNYPCSITTDGLNLYVADAGNETIRKIAISTQVVTTIAGAPGVFGSSDGNGSTARFNGPDGIVTDGTNLYVTDCYNNTIRKIVIANGDVTTIAGASGTAGSADGIGTSARFNSPLGITTDGSNLYVADAHNQTIREVVISTASVTTIAGSPGMAGSTDGSGSTATFNGPDGITTDGKNLYVSDWYNSSIRKIY